MGLRAGWDRYTDRAMIPYLHLFHLQIPTFGLMLWLAAVVAAFVMDRSFRRAGVEVDAVNMVAVAVVAGVVGAKLWHVLDTPEEFRMMGWAVLWDSAGFAWFGGLVGGLGTMILMGWRSKAGCLRTLDLASVAAAVGYGIGRLGCLLSGDGCYGLPTTGPLGMAFPNGIEPTDAGVKVYPTPLFEFGIGIVLAAWLWMRGGKTRPKGALLGEYLLLSGVARFLIEFLRRNPKVLLGLSNAQLASVASVLAGVVLMIWAAKHSDTSTGAAVEAESQA